MRKIEIYCDSAGTVQRKVFYGHRVDNQVRAGTPPYWTLIKIFNRKGKCIRIFRCGSYMINITKVKKKGD